MDCQPLVLSSRTHHMRSHTILLISYTLLFDAAVAQVLQLWKSNGNTHDAFQTVQFLPPAHWHKDMPKCFASCRNVIRQFQNKIEQAVFAIIAIVDVEICPSSGASSIYFFPFFSYIYHLNVFAWLITYSKTCWSISNLWLSCFGHRTQLYRIT